MTLSCQIHLGSAQGLVVSMLMARVICNWSGQQAQNTQDCCQRDLRKSKKMDKVFCIPSMKEEVVGEDSDARLTGRSMA